MNNDPAARRIQVFADPAALARAAAEELTRRAHRRRARPTAMPASRCPAVRRPRCSTACSPTNPPSANVFPGRRRTFFFGDERHVPPDHKDSNFRMAREAMFDKMAGILPPENIHRIHGEEADASKAADDYGDRGRGFFRRDGHPGLRFDVILLGMGPEGHTASIFPGTTGPARDEARRLRLHRKADAPTASRSRRRCSGRRRLMLYLVAGKDKADMLADGAGRRDRRAGQIPRAGHHRPRRRNALAAGQGRGGKADGCARSEVDAMALTAEECRHER